MGAAEGTTGIDDERVRVTTWSFAAPGDRTGPHVHEYDYLVVPVTGGTFTIVAPDGSTREMTQHAGQTYAGRAGTDHDVVSASPTPISFVEIELKQ